MERASGLKPADTGWITKLLYWAMRKRIGRVPKVKKLAAYDLSTLMASSWMDAVGASAKTIPILLKELVQLKVAAMVGCPF